MDVNTAASRPTIRIGNTEITAPGTGEMPVLSRLVESDVDMDSLPEDVRRRVEECSREVSLSDAMSIAGYAAKPQRELTRHLDQLLASVKTSDLGQAGVLVAELAQGIEGIDFDAMRSEVEGTASGRIRAMLRRLPVLGSRFAHVERLKAMSDDLMKHLESIHSKANAEMVRLREGTRGMDALLVHTEANLRELALWLKGGALALRRMREEVEGARAEAARTGDPIQTAVVQERVELVNAFETRLVRLHFAFTRGLQNMPEIRLIQRSVRTEYQETMDTVLTDIPEIKSALVRIEMLRQVSKSNENSAARRRLRRDLGRIGQDMQETAFLKVRDGQADFEKDIQFLVETAQRQADLRRRGVEIDREAKLRREQAMGKIVEIQRGFVAQEREQARDELSASFP